MASVSAVATRTAAAISGSKARLGMVLVLGWRELNPGPTRPQLPLPVTRAQCVDGVDQRRAARWVVAEEYADQRRGGEGNEHERRRQRDRPGAPIGECERRACADDEADEPAGEAERHRFDQELREDVAAARAQARRWRSSPSRRRICCRLFELEGH